MVQGGRPQVRNWNFGSWGGGTLIGKYRRHLIWGMLYRGEGEGVLTLALKSNPSPSQPQMLNPPPPPPARGVKGVHVAPMKPRPRESGDGGDPLTTENDARPVRPLTTDQTDDDDSEHVSLHEGWKIIQYDC